ncbi:spermidine/putrescine ABC transporter substrate-binding protein [Frigoribacterium sp. VKM Ac-2836]|uniref:spermidine/putrescine ABC transporter substrate-binding protein n=1 Tax=Frigoribacterium sp. VKM Ac-2836 TaxID=2739014 RepID=UPI0015633802|nr:spermidine/putrescine ABC transporter substrate-binding protein [Frigoribacterium sp. VKM Ac-2836]NRD27207.1 spermidine/putrescine ABC transporter substrate-binding protein [Frigoribacterium sp. VKM Ac-2836]
MAEQIEGRVSSAVDAWLRWLPRWHIGTARGRTRPCRVCLGSPVATAAGFDHDVPHAVQHALLNRMRQIVDDDVDEYTARNLPLVTRELRLAEAQEARGYRPDQGLDPEFQGLDLDPEPEPGQPFLFTLAGLAGMPADDGIVPPDPTVTGGEPAGPTAEADVETASQDVDELDGWLLPPDWTTPTEAVPPGVAHPAERPEHPPGPAPRSESHPTPESEYSDEAKAALRHEITLAGDHAEAVGTSLCLALVQHRSRIAEAIDRLVAPQVDELLAELSRALEQPRSR